MPPPTCDIDRIMAIMASAFEPEYGEAWTRRQVEDALVLGNCHYLLANEAGEDCTGNDGGDSNSVAGFTLSRGGYGEEELLLFAVAPQFRGRGVGNRLLERFVQVALGRGATRLLLEMRRGNPAESIYSRHGFKPVGVRKNYYSTRSGGRLDAITFSCAAPVN
ncbi:MAG: GNAT family N-acetyltransferase [Pseudomonadota bacterium]